MTYSIKGCLHSLKAEIKPYELDAGNADERSIYACFYKSKEFSTDSDRLTVAELLSMNQLPTIGVAVAVNNKVVRKSDWDSAELAQDDNVTVITAVCGG